METVGSPALWLGFVALVLGMLALDLGIFHRKAHAVSLKEAGVWSAVWVGLAALFAAAVYAGFGPERALEFTTGYLIEKALAVETSSCSSSSSRPLASRPRTSIGCSSGASSAR